LVIFVDETQSPGNIGFEAAPFKLPLEYVEVLGGVDGPAYIEFKRLFHEGFMAARKHCDRIISMCPSTRRRKSNSYEASALVELMQKDSSFPCFVALGAQTATQLRERFQPTLTHALVGEHCDRLIETSVGSNWTRLYDSVCLDLRIAPPSANFCVHSSNTIRNRFCECHIVDFVEHSILVIAVRPRQKVL
jgi:phosphatidylinositol kinase/protein kinase (PI-3  family)